MTWLEIVANGAAILTAIIATLAAAYIACDARKKRLKVEEYLKGVKASAAGSKKGQQTILHLMARLGLTEAEILQASFRSSRIRRTLAENRETGRPEAMFLEYNDGPS